MRGRLLGSIGSLLFALGVLLSGLFILAVIDAVYPLAAAPRFTVMLLFLLSAAALGGTLAFKPWLNERFKFAAGEQIDRAGGALDQPVTRGLSLREPMDDDSLALMLIQRAEQRAADVAQSVEPRRAYPLANLRRQGRWLLLALGLWVLLAIILPGQFFSIFTRVALPWNDAPPFSLTQLDPTWEPKPPDAGDDVRVSVLPEGLMPESVDLLRVDSDGSEAERFEMLADAAGTFHYTLRQVEQPITFKLEAHGRATRSYTIQPTPRPPADADDDPNTDQGDETNDGGSTTYDPDRVIARDITTHPDWPDLKAKLDSLMAKLAEVQANAASIDPIDAKALAELADQIAELSADAKALAGDLQAVRGELPPDAAAALAELQAALAGMQSATIPAPPGSSASPSAGTPTPADWLDQAAKAAAQDRLRIAKGVGPSDQPTPEGVSSGNPDGTGPTVRDPSTSGTYDETGTNGESGPLPAAVMQQVPPSYRPLITAYFDRLAEPEPDTP